MHNFAPEHTVYMKSIYRIVLSYLSIEVNLKYVLNSSFLCSIELAPSLDAAEVYISVLNDVITSAFQCCELVCTVSCLLQSDRIESRT